MQSTGPARSDGVIFSSTYTYICWMNHNDTIIKQTSENFFNKIYLSLYCNLRKGLLSVLWWEGVGDRTELQYIDPHSYGRQRCVFLVLQGCSTGGPGAQLSAECWLSLPHLVSNFSGPQLIRGPKGPISLVWLSLAHLVYNSFSNCNCLTSVLTELYNSSMPTQSPTRSLEWHVWSSSSGNNCHAVHRALSSGASVYECTMVILACLILLANFRPRDFLS